VRGGSALGASARGADGGTGTLGAPGEAEPGGAVAAIADGGGAAADGGIDGVPAPAGAIRSDAGAVGTAMLDARAAADEAEGPAAGMAETPPADD
jgi:hypothetical protein